MRGGRAAAVPQPIKSPDPDFGCLCRKLTVDYASAYRERIKRLGEDACKEEFQLRAVESVVNLFRANHPGVGIDAAKTAVLAAIAAKGEAS